jgi:pimeloyl-ACP methyl ester carboxylesterase
VKADVEPGQLSEGRALGGTPLGGYRSGLANGTGQADSRHVSGLIDDAAHAKSLAWTWQGKTIELGLDWRGEGRTVLLLPALSSISTRREMQPLQDRLSARFRTVSIDWPGFGDVARPHFDWSPETYYAFLEFLLAPATPPLHAVIAAGHGAIFALVHAVRNPGSIRRLVLIAPTWRGPLPTMMDGDRPIFRTVAQTFDLPVIGPLLYKLNVSRFVIRRMAAGHVYTDPAWLNADRLRDKLAVTRARGARFASVRFVTGLLDPLKNREQLLGLAQEATFPILMVYGDQTPRRSRSEMQCLSTVPGVQTVCLPKGKLALHDEFPNAVADVITPFLSED